MDQTDMVEDMELILDPIAQDFRVKIKSNEGFDSEVTAAARRGDIDAVQKLLKAGTEVDSRDALERTALMVASGGGHSEVVKILLDVGADVNAGIHGHTALFGAAFSGHSEVVKILLDAGADADLSGTHESTALMLMPPGSTRQVEVRLQGAGIDV